MSEKTPNCIYQIFDSGEYDCSLTKKACNWRPRKGCPDKIERHTKVETFKSSELYWKGQTRALAEMVERMFRKEQHRFETGRAGEKFIKKRRKLGHYNFIARPALGLISNLVLLRELMRVEFNKARNYDKPSFLDCGCGVGNVVAYAHFAGFSSYGVEYDQATLDRGKFILDLFSLKQDRLMQGDLLEYDDFGKYDVLYGYCPLSSTEKERIFEARLMYQAKVGAYIVGLGNHRTIAHVKADNSGLITPVDETRRRGFTDTIHLQSVGTNQVFDGYQRDFAMKKVAHVKVGSTSKKT